MKHTLNTIRFVPTILALALAATGRAQISNVTSDLVYNNVEEAWDSSLNFFGYQQQFVIAPNAGTLTSPMSAYTFTNPSTNGTGNLMSASSATSSVSSTSNSATLNASGYAFSAINTLDSTSTYWSAASGGVDLYLDLTTTAIVSFDVSSFTSTANSGVQFGANNIYVGDFLTGGNHTATTTIGPGSYDFFMFYFTQLPLATMPSSSSAFAGGDYSISVQSTPEPSSMAVLGIGALGILRLRKKK